MISPQDVESREFTVRLIRPGYDPEEVDAFLELVSASYRQVLIDVSRLREENDRLRSQPTQAIPPVIGDVARMLQIAQRTVDEQLAEANGEAGRIVVQARQQAEEIIAEGHEKRHAMIGQLEDQRSRLSDEVAVLNQAKDIAASALKKGLSILDGEVR